MFIYMYMYILVHFQILNYISLKIKIAVLFINLSFIYIIDLLY